MKETSYVHNNTDSSVWVNFFLSFWALRHSPYKNSFAKCVAETRVMFLGWQSTLYFPFLFVRFWFGVFF